MYWCVCPVFMTAFPCLVVNTLSNTKNESTLTMNGWSDPSSVSDKSLSSSSSSSSSSSPSPSSGPSSVHSGCCGIRLRRILRLHISIYTGVLISLYPDQEGNRLQRPNSNFCKPLKNNSEGCPSNQVSVAAMTPSSDEKWRPFNCFFSVGSG